MLSDKAKESLGCLTDIQKQVYIVAKSEAVKGCNNRKFITVNSIYYSGSNHICMCIETVRRALNKLSELGILEKKATSGFNATYYFNDETV